MADRTPVTIREDIKGRILLTGLHQVNINSIEDLLNALNFGSSIRQTDSTTINAKSSRSHAVFSINLIQRKSKAQPTTARDKRMSMPIEAMSGSEDFVTMDSKLHFVDLAGSERLKNTGATGDRAREGISINAGLASLGKVISQLSSRHSGNHVSYRDSKLTRLLQDSLGGNAITYMIACVTPAEFHLSETLNTVSYAQRARAIQSRPQLQQVADDGDKQAVIDRLRAEVSFLRDQIRSSERGANVPQERSERQNEREMELQNHLLDVQENYTALSQRHAKLISEITRARDDDPGETPTLTETIGGNAVERLKRSNSFAEAVEQVVLEYEKTIQSLETSLSNTRSSLASTESALMEKENRVAYIETLNNQLQSRVQKLMDRESGNEQYLHTLEARLDGQASGDEKNTALVVELRKEIARIRENEAQCEDYISTLEERLAEADQDMELKQRELDRLEHVVERQRSLGKLDNLLYEFDHLQNDGNAKHPTKQLTNGVAKSAKGIGMPKSILEEAAETAIPDSDDEDLDTHTSNGHVPEDNDTVNGPESTTARASPATRDKAHQAGPGQRRIEEANKLDTVSRELYALRLQHESTVGEYDMMAAKYEEALRTLAELQDANAHEMTSPTSTRPTSFLGDARVHELKDGGQVPSSRSLSSELSLAGDSNTSLEPSTDESSHTMTYTGDSSKGTPREAALMRELEELKAVQAQKDEGMKTLNGRYTELQELHLETLDIVEELKADVTKAKMNNPASPTSPVIRRKSSQNVMTIDRAHRSFASLRNIAAENFEDKPDTMQSFELNLNTAMHELHQRSERVQLLEAELTTVKKEMDNKVHMISGLTRERSSLKTTSPIMDMTVMATMNDQLVQREQQMRQLQDKHNTREEELTTEVQNLKKAIDKAESASSNMPGFFPETPAPFDASDKQLGGQPQQDVQRLQEEVEQWQHKHKSAVDSMQASERRLLSTITELETSLIAVETMKNQAEDKAKRSVRRSIADADFESERKLHVDQANSLQDEIADHKVTIDSHVDRISRLEQLQNDARDQNDEAERFRTANESQLESHRQQISQLEQQIQQHQSAVDFHKHGLKSLHDSHSRDIEGLRNEVDDHVAQKAELEGNLQTMRDTHTSHITRLESDIVDLKTQLLSSTGSMSDELQHARTAMMEIEKQRSQLQVEVNMLKDDIANAAKTNETNLVRLEELKQEKDRATGLVDQLEEQLTSSYEQQRASSSRYSLLNNSVNTQVHSANEEKLLLERQLRESQSQLEMVHVSLTPPVSDPQNTNNSILQHQLRDSQQNLERSPSRTANLRKSASAQSLPSPPPAIPLPPLPPNAVTSPTASSFPQSLSAADPGKLQKELDGLSNMLMERDNHMKQMEKHLFAEKQLTQTLEEALADLEAGQKRGKADVESWKKKCWNLEDELSKAKKEGGRERERWSLQAVEEEKGKRREAERAREELEERMKGLQESGKKKKKKGGGLNCF